MSCPSLARKTDTTETVVSAGAEALPQVSSVVGGAAEKVGEVMSAAAGAISNAVEGITNSNIGYIFL